MIIVFDEVKAKLRSFHFPTTIIIFIPLLTHQTERFNCNNFSHIRILIHTLCNIMIINCLFSLRSEIYQ